jgi:predicted neutral ceramidase superfamily lipid hydrolase
LLTDWHDILLIIYCRSFYFVFCSYLILSSLFLTRCDILFNVVLVFIISSTPFPFSVFYNLEESSWVFVSLLSVIQMVYASCILLLSLVNSRCSVGVHWKYGLSSKQKWSFLMENWNTEVYNECCFPLI